MVHGYHCAYAVFPVHREKRNQDRKAIVSFRTLSPRNGDINHSASVSDPRKTGHVKSP